MKAKYDLIKMAGWIAVAIGGLAMKQLKRLGIKQIMLRRQRMMLLPTLIRNITCLHPKQLYQAVPGRPQLLLG